MNQVMHPDMDKLQLTAEQSDCCTIVHLEGYLNQSGGEALKRVVKDVLVAPPATLVLDFAATSLVNSIGISSLLDVIEAAKKKKTPIQLIRVPEEIAELFTLLGITLKVPVTS